MGAVQFFQDREKEILKCWNAFFGLLGDGIVPYPIKYADAYNRAAVSDDRKLKEDFIGTFDFISEFVEEVADKVPDGIKEKAEELMKKLERFREQYVEAVNPKLRHDLTGLWNGKALNIFINEYVLPNIEERDFVFLVLKVDNLKGIRKAYGEKQFEVFIKNLAKELLSSFKPKDFVSCLDDFKFCIVMADILPNTAYKFATGLVENLRKQKIFLEYNGKRVPVSPSVSVGLTNIIAADSLKELIRRATSAMNSSETEVGYIRI